MSAPSSRPGAFRRSGERLRDAALQSSVQRDLAEREELPPIGRAEVLAVCGYVVTLFGSHLYLRGGHGEVMRAVVAALPMLPVLVVVLLALRRVLAMDELQRRIELVGLAVASAGVWLAMFTCWSLQRAGLDAPPLSIWLIAMPVLRYSASRWARRYYQ